MNGFARALRDKPNRCWTEPTMPSCRGMVGPQLPARRRELPHGAIDPELLDVRPELRAPGPDVRSDRLVDAAGAPVPDVGVVGVVRGPDRRARRARPTSTSATPPTCGATVRTPSTAGPTSPGCSTTPTSTWGYFVGNGTCWDPPCAPTDEPWSLARPQPRARGSCESAATDLTDNILTLRHFLAARAGRRPARRSRGSCPTRWAASTRWAPRRAIKDGQAHVTRMINAVMQSQLLGHVGDLRDLGRLGRVLRPRGTAGRRRERLRDAGPRARDLALREGRVHRPPDAHVRRLPEAHRGSVPGRPAPAAAGAGRWSARRSSSSRSRTPSTSRRSPASR